MQISILGIDIGKNSVSVVGVDEQGAVILRRTMRRQTLIDFVEKLQRCVIAMEACCDAHHLGRLFAAGGHEVRLMSPEYVRPVLPSCLTHAFQVSKRDEIAERFSPSEGFSFST